MLTWANTCEDQGQMRMATCSATSNSHKGQKLVPEIYCAAIHVLMQKLQENASDRAVLGGGRVVHNDANLQECSPS